MPDVTDIIAKLSYEVGGAQDVKQVTDEFQKQVNNIDKLKGKLLELEGKYSTTQGVNEQQRLSNAILNTKKAIDQQTASAQRLIANNKAFGESVTADIGKIQQLTEYISQASKEQATLTDVAQIKKYTESIRAAQVQLKALLEPFKEIREVGAIEALEQKITQLNNAIRQTTNFGKEIKPGGFVDKAELGRLNTELNKTKIQLKDLQNIGKEPIVSIRQVGAIEAVENRLSILKNTLKTVPKENIQQVRDEITKTEARLRQLTETDKESESSRGFLANLLGVTEGSAGRQVLRGVLQGAGIGAGLSIIPAIVSNLIEYTSALLDTRDAEFVAKEGVQALNTSLVGQLSAFTDLNKVLSEAFGGLNTYQIEVERVAAAGVQNGQVFTQRKNQFKAEQDAREAEISELSDLQGVYRQLTDALVRYDQTKNLGALQDRIKNIGLSATELGRINNVIKKTFEEINSLPTAALREKAKKELQLSENDDLIKARAQTNTRLNQLIEENDIKRIAFESQTSREIYELNKKLNADIASANDKFAQDEISRQEKTTDNIEEQINIQARAATRALNLELEEARRQGTLTTETEAKFDERFSIIVKEFDAKKLEAKRVFYLQQLQLQEQFNQQLLSEELRASRQRLSETTDPIENLDLRRDINNKELELQLAKISQEATTQTQSLYKLQEERRQAGKTETVEYQQTQTQINEILDASTQQQDDAVRTANIRRLGIYSDYYKNDLIPLIRAQQQLVVSELQLSLSEELRSIESNGTSFFENAFFGVDFEKNIATKRNQIEQFKAQILADRRELEAANTRKGSAEDNFATATAGGDSGAIKAAGIELNAAKTRVNELQAAINKSEEGIKVVSRTITTEYVKAVGDSFKEMAQQAVNAYNVIADARQQDLDREISAREQRVELAYKLAERGNTVALQQEQEYLRESQQQKRKAALEQQAINSALALSLSIVAIAQAAALPPPYNLAAIPAVISALAAGYATITQLTRSQQTTPGFKDGVIGFEGAGSETSDSNLVRISKGESIMTAAATRKYGTALEAMQMGLFPAALLPEYLPSSGSIGRKEFDMLAGEFRDGFQRVETAVMAEKINVYHDERGFAMSVDRAVKSDRRRWTGA